MERLHDELMREEASPQFVSGIAQAIAIHIAPNYSETLDRRGSPSGFKFISHVGNVIGVISLDHLF